MPPLHGREHVEPVHRTGEHSFKCRNLQNGVEATRNLLARLAEGAAVEELVVEEGARSRIEAGDVGRKGRWVGGLHQFAEGVDGRSGYGQHETGDIGEGRALLGGQFAGERAEHVIEQLDDAGFHLLAH